MIQQLSILSLSSMHLSHDSIMVIKISHSKTPDNLMGIDKSELPECGTLRLVCFD